MTQVLKHFVVLAAGNATICSIVCTRKITWRKENEEKKKIALNEALFFLLLLFYKKAFCVFVSVDASMELDEFIIR